jgi:hypothetical protein
MSDTFEITGDLDEPYYYGSAPSGPDEVGLDCSVAGRGFLLNLDENLGYYHRYQVTSINLLNTQQAQNGNDLAQVSPEIWRRIIESWDQGAGQLSMDRKDSVPNRYYTSTGIDVWNPWRFSLLHDVANIQALAAGKSFLSTCGPSQLVAATGSSLYWWGANLAVAPTTVALTGGPIIDMAATARTSTPWAPTGTSDSGPTRAPRWSGCPGSPSPRTGCCCATSRAS